MTTHEIITQYAHVYAKLQALQAEAQQAVDTDPGQYRCLKHMGVKRMLISKNIKALFIRVFFTLCSLAGSTVVVYQLNVHGAPEGTVLLCCIALLILNVFWILYVWTWLRLYGKSAFE